MDFCRLLVSDIVIIPVNWYWGSSKKNVAMLIYAPGDNIYRNQTIFELMKKVTVYSTKNCPYSRMAKAFLDKHGIPYEEIDVGEDSDAAKKMIDTSQVNAEFPVIIVDNEVIVGFDSQRLNDLFGETLSG